MAHVALEGYNRESAELQRHLRGVEQPSGAKEYRRVWTGIMVAFGLVMLTRWRKVRPWGADTEVVAKGQPRMYI